MPSAKARSVAGRSLLAASFFPDHWGKLKFLLLCSSDASVRNDPTQEHQAFYQYVLWLKTAFDPDAEKGDATDAEVQVYKDAVDTYLEWFESSDRPVFIGVRDEQEWAKRGRLDIHRSASPVPLPVWVDPDREMSITMLGRAPIRYVSGRVCLADLMGEPVHVEHLVVYHIPGFTAKMYRCEHPEIDMVERCGQPAGHCIECEHRSKNCTDTDVRRLSASMWWQLRSTALRHLIRAKVVLEHHTWDFILEQGGAGMEYEVPENVLGTPEKQG